MIIFSIVWLPLFFLFWRALYARQGMAAEAAFGGLAGIFIAAFRIIFGPLIHPAGNFEIWLSGFIDYTSLAPLLAILACLLLPRFFRFRSTLDDWTLFMLAAYVPAAPVYTIAWSAFPHPLHLVLPPLLWASAALAMSVSRRIWLFPRRHNIPNKRFIFAALALFLAAGLLCLNAVSYFAFFLQKPLAGALFLAPSLGFSIAGFCVQSRGGGAEPPSRSVPAG